jgi:hypothetical protein
MYIQKTATGLALVFCSVAFTSGQVKPLASVPSPAGYTIHVHFSATHFRQCALVGAYSICRGGIYADAIVDGKKVELFGEVHKENESLIVPGDYSARLAEKKPRDQGKPELFQRYSVRLPDKSEWPCQITGFSE